MSEQRKVEKEVRIQAGADEVWKALTDAEEIKRWFPLDARVKPGVGGAIWFSFGEGMEWESPIEIWEPNRRLRTVDTYPGDPEQGVPPTRLAVDYTIESHDGETLLRLVHSGFNKTEWDDELDTMDSGWATFLQLLKHYLERHAGERRTLVHYRHPAVSMSRAEAHALLLDALQLERNQARYELTLGGERVSGETRVDKVPVNFSGTVEAWNDAFLMIEIEPGADRCRPSMWISLFGEGQRFASSVQKSIEELLKATFEARVSA